jgi:cytochrome b involved in lipid metabolism
MFFYDNYDIVIVGGGISGLFLAYKLVDTNLNILVLEKEKEFGGRIHTVLKNGYQYECGAARFSNKHNRLLTLIHELGLKEDIIELSDQIDTVIDGNKGKYNIDKLLHNAILKSKDYSKDQLQNIVFYQYLIDVYDFKTADYINTCFGYDSEFFKLNAHAAMSMFKKGLFHGDTKYYVLKNGLSSIIKEMTDLLEISNNVTLKLEDGLSELTDSLVTTEKGYKYNYEKIIFTIPQESLKKVEYLKDVKELDSVNGIPLLRVYFKYPVKGCNPWFKNIKRTTTDNYIRHIIPVDYKNGLIMISYTDHLYAEMLLTIYNSGKDKLIKAIHKEIKVLFGIDPPEPEEVFFHYWENGCHFWKTGEDMNKVYEKIMKPMNDKELYICGESFSKKQAWMEGSLETCYDVMKEMKLKNIKVKQKKEKKLKKYSIDDVLKEDKWIVMDIEDELRVYDLSKWISEHPGGDKIYNGIKANMYYKDKSKSPKSPMEVFMGNQVHKDKNVLKRFLLQKNKYVKLIGYLK